MVINNDFVYAQMKFISYFGESLIFLLPVAFLLAAFFIKFRHRIEGFLLLFSLFSYIYSVLLKFIFQIQRPATASYTDLINSYSFPSSHVVVYTAFFGYLLYLTFAIKKFDRFSAFFLRFISIYFIALVGLSRVLLGEHWTTDVIAGYGFGILYLGMTILIEKRLYKSMTKNKQ